MRRAVMPLIDAVLVTVGILGIVVTATYSRPLDPPGAVSASGMDAMFIEQMIPHHDD